MFKQASATVALSLLACTSAYAAEESLDFRLVVMPAEITKLDAPNVPGQTVFAGKWKGAAYFKDGRVAAKDFILISDSSKGSGPIFGYSTYHFDDGSSLIARFEGKNETGKGSSGEYTVISGTGKYEGVRGTGSFSQAPHKLQGANLLNGSFKLTTP